MTMAYIIALNPNLLTGFGAEGQNLWNGYTIFFDSFLQFFSAPENFITF